ncbi:hypothetical protein ACFVJM_39015 [Streptomyces virginiae]|uniref:hypothetical protein n=1 Tax=Streptomyces virginiae TaxID=1961 RepID=UPI00363A2542
MWVNGDEQRRVVHVGGEMDIDRAGMLGAALHAAITEAGGHDEIVVDLAGLSFLRFLRAQRPGPSAADRG